MKTQKNVRKFYKAIIQSILIFGLESWTISTAIINKLNSFHRQCARFIIGKHIHLLENNTWSYPNRQETLETKGLRTIEEYIDKGKQTVKTYAQSTAIYKECNELKASPRYSAQITWWKDLENEQSVKDKKIIEK
jgi:hypothetical protein